MIRSLACWLALLSSTRSVVGAVLWRPLVAASKIVVDDTTPLAISQFDHHRVGKLEPVGVVNAGEGCLLGPATQARDSPGSGRMLSANLTAATENRILQMPLARFDNYSRPRLCYPWLQRALPSRCFLPIILTIQIEGS